MTLEHIPAEKCDGGGRFQAKSRRRWSPSAKDQQPSVVREGLRCKRPNTGCSWMAGKNTMGTSELSEKLGCPHASECSGDPRPILRSDKKTASFSVSQQRLWHHHSTCRSGLKYSHCGLVKISQGCGKLGMTSCSKDQVAKTSHICPLYCLRCSLSTAQTEDAALARINRVSCENKGLHRTKTDQVVAAVSIMRRCWTQLSLSFPSQPPLSGETSCGAALTGTAGTEPIEHSWVPSFETPRLW